MKKRVLSTVLVLAMCLCAFAALNPAAAATTVPTQQQAYEAMVAMKSQYPEGMRWTNDNFYSWKGGIYSGGGGCAGFAFLLSDAAFDDLPARMLTDFAFSDVKTGDILRINNDTHSVIVLEVYSDSVVIAEGNYNNSIHWGRRLTKAAVEAADNLITRYPAEEPEPSEPEPSTPTTSTTFSDVATGRYYTNAVAWAVEQGITDGVGGGKFAPERTCTHGEIITMLWRAAGSPEADSQAPMTVGKWYVDAVNWAYENGIIDATFQESADCTRASTVTYIWKAKSSPAASGSNAFTDIPAGANYLQAVNWAVAQKITDGTGNGSTFSPDNTCTRGEIVTFLERAFNK